MTGEARDIVDEREPVPCEFAIAAADRWRGMRLGCRLLERLVDRTVRSCIPRMSADTVATDKLKPALAGARRLRKAAQARERTARTPGQRAAGSGSVRQPPEARRDRRHA